MTSHKDELLADVLISRGRKNSLHDIERAATALRFASQPSDAAAMKVKPLEWARPDGLHERVVSERTRCLVGTYTVWGGGGWNLDDGTQHTTPARSLEAAKAAAQADYEQRIRSALSIDAITVAPAGKTAAADDVVTALYRRFKEWSKRGFGPDDVTWCEVKADIEKLIAPPVGDAGAMREALEALIVSSQAARDHIGSWSTVDNNGEDRFIKILKIVEPLERAIKAANIALSGRDKESDGGESIRPEYDRGFKAGRDSWKEIIDQQLAYTAELEAKLSDPTPSAEPVRWEWLHPHPVDGDGIWRTEQYWNGHTSKTSRPLYARPAAPVDAEEIAHRLGQVLKVMRSARSNKKQMDVWPDDVKIVEDAIAALVAGKR